MIDHHAVRVAAAAFLAEALALPDPPAALASDLTPVDDDGTVAVFAAEVDSSVGLAAFLVYVYAIAPVDDGAPTGRVRFGDDLDVLRTAAERDAPGPRLVAHALSDSAGFLLATSPATLRALAGATAPALPGPDTDPVPNTDPRQARADAAATLLRLLQAADREAADWLTARDAAATGGFVPEETALALFLLDDRSIRSLLTVLDRVLTTAREDATTRLGDRA